MSSSPRISAIDQLYFGRYAEGGYPGVRQKVLNRVSRLRWRGSMNCYRMPWLILIARRAKR